MIKTITIYAHDSEGKMDYKGNFPASRADSFICTGVDDQRTIQKAMDMLNKKERTYDE
jgi:hypothetical protein